MTDADEGSGRARGGWQPSERLIDALAVATRLHATQVRKSTTIPYVSHLYGACSIALDYGANEDEAIGALLHDAIEDADDIQAAREAVAAFGPRVVHIVEACTDGTPGPDGKKPPWQERKEAYLWHLATADAGVLLVSASDKLHNARSILADLRRDPEQLWTRFNASREQTLWYYRGLVDAFRANALSRQDLVDELDRTVSEIERISGEIGVGAR
jgi:(p)ppGpp synthase/HD superfamily hydrolase